MTKQKYRLLTAVSHGRNDRVKNLLKAGANVHVKEDFRGFTALIFASYRGNIELINELVKYGANVNAQDKRGRTALMHAVIYNQYDVVVGLLLLSADVNIKCNKSFTAFDYAIKRTHDRKSAIMLFTFMYYDILIKMICYDIFSYIASFI
jgi:ankyrin repeat protein